MAKVAPMNQHATSRASRGRGAFTLVEMLIVIGLVLVLVALVVPAVSMVRIKAQSASTAAQLNAIRGAIESYFQTFQAYPGPLRDEEMYQQAAGAWGIPGVKVTMSENLTLGLVGGLDSATGKYRADQLGMGPARRDGTRYKPFMENWAEMVSKGQVGNFDSAVPEFVDRFTDEALPIVYLRARRGAKGIISDQSTGGELYQYDLRQILPYTMGSPRHGLKGLGDINSRVQPYQALPYFRNPQIPSPNNMTGTPRSKDTFILISAGPDHIYGTNDDITSFGSVWQE